MKQLMLMRARGLAGPFFNKFFGTILKTSIGNYFTGVVLNWTTMGEVNVSQGGTWDIELNNYVIGLRPVTFAIATGALPAGITLNVDGTFSGTVTPLSGTGSVTFNATNPDGTVESGTLNWSIP